MQQDAKRRAWIVAALLCAIVAGAVWWWRARTKVDAPHLAAAIPAGAQTVLLVDFAALRSGGLLDRIAGPPGLESAEYKEFIRASGFDYRRDLDIAVVGWEGSTTYLAVAGRFDGSRLRSYAASHNGRCEGDYCTLPASDGMRSISFYPPRRNVLAMAVSASGDAARRVGLSAPGRAAPPVPAAPVWLATSGATLRSASLPAGTLQFAKLLAPAERVTFAASGNPAGDFSVTLDAVYPTPQEAAVTLVQMEALTSMLRKLIADSKQPPNPRDLSGVLTGGTFQKEDRRLNGRWPVRREFFEGIAGGN